MIEIYENGKFRPWVGHVVQGETLVDDACLYYDDKNKVYADNWNVIGGDYGALRLTATTRATLYMTSSDSLFEVKTIMYRTTDAPRWVNYALGTVIELEPDGWVEFWNTAESLSRDSHNYIQIVGTGIFRGTGRITSLIDYSTECEPFCFYKLFEGLQLEHLPRLDVTILAPYCFAYMFAYNESLIYVPKDLLPLEDLHEGCYKDLFAHNSFLRNSPALPAKAGAPHCYEEMFQHCTNMTYIEVSLESWGSDQNQTTNWVIGINSKGTFSKRACLPTLYDESHIPPAWEDTFVEPLSIHVDSKSVLTLHLENPDPSMDLRLRINTSDQWVRIDKTTSWELPAHSTVELYNASSVLGASKESYVNIQSDQPLAIRGRLTALCDHFECPDYTYTNLFQEVSIQILDVRWPVTLGVGGFYRMFYKAKILDPDIKINLQYKHIPPHCFEATFKQTSWPNVNKPVEIGAEAVDSYGFYQTFEDSNITNIPINMSSLLTVQEWGYAQCFKNCPGITHSAIEFQENGYTGDYSFYECFRNCKGIETSEIKIPPSTSQGYCALGGLFSGCVNLTEIVADFYAWRADLDMTKGWVEGLYSGDFYKYPRKKCVFKKPDNLLDIVKNADFIPRNWYIETLYAYDASTPTVDVYNPLSPTEPGLYIKQKGATTSYIKFLPKRQDTFKDWSFTNVILRYKITPDSEWISACARSNTLTMNGAWDAVQLSGDYTKWDILTAGLWGPDYSIGVVISGGACTVQGNLNTFWVVAPPEYTYANLLAGSDGLVDASGMYFESTGITGEFYGLFRKCINLQVAPAVAHEVNAPYIFARCYQDCESLKNPVILKGVSAPEYACYSMYYNCANLTTTGDIPFIFVEDHALSYMFAYCTRISNSVTLKIANIQPPDLALTFSLSTQSGADIRPFIPLTGPYISSIQSTVKDTERVWQHCTLDYKITFSEYYWCIKDPAGNKLAKRSWQDITGYWEVSDYLGDPEGVILYCNQITLRGLRISGMFLNCVNIPMISSHHPLSFGEFTTFNWLESTGQACIERGETPFIYLLYGCTFSDYNGSPDIWPEVQPFTAACDWRNGSSVPPGWDIIYLTQGSLDTPDSLFTSTVKGTVLYTACLSMLQIIDDTYRGYKRDNLHVEGSCLYFDQ